MLDAFFMNCAVPSVLELDDLFELRRAAIASVVLTLWVLLRLALACCFSRAVLAEEVGSARAPPMARDKGDEVGAGCDKGCDGIDRERAEVLVLARVAALGVTVGVGALSNDGWLGAVSRAGVLEMAACLDLG